MRDRIEAAASSITLRLCTCVRYVWVWAKCVRVCLCVCLTRTRARSLSFARALSLCPHPHPPTHTHTHTDARKHLPCLQCRAAGDGHPLRHALEHDAGSTAQAAARDSDSSPNGVRRSRDAAHAHPEALRRHSSCDLLICGPFSV